MIVAGAGTGGTLTGLARKIKEKVPNVQVLVFPTFCGWGATNVIRSLRLKPGLCLPTMG